MLGTAPCSVEPCTSIVRTEDGGTTWVGIPAPKATLQINSAVPGQVARLRFADARNGWAFDGALYSTHDGGSTWTRQNLGSDGHGPLVLALDSGGGYAEAVVDSCSPFSGDTACKHTLRVYRTPIGTDRWTPATATIDDSTPGFGYYPAQLIAHGLDWWLSAKSIYQANGAHPATRLSSPCAGARLAVADRAHLDALCAGGGAAGSSRQQLYGTTDGGARWTRSGAAFLGATDITGMADNTRGVLLISESSGGSEILRTADDGRSIHTALSPGNTGGEPWADLGYTTPSQAVVILNGTTMYLSRDAGATWAPIRF